MKINKKLLPLLCLSLGITAVNAQTTVLNYKGSGQVLKNPERGLSYKAGFVDLFVNGYTYDGAVTYDWDQNFLLSNGTTTSKNFRAAKNRAESDRSLNVPIGYEFKNSAPNSLITITNDLEIPTLGNHILEITFLNPISPNSLMNESYLEMSYKDINGDNMVLVIEDATHPGTSSNYTYLRLKNLTDNTTSTFVYYAPDITQLSIQNIGGHTAYINGDYVVNSVNIDITNPVQLKIHSDVSDFTINQYDRKGFLDKRFEFPSPHFEKKHDSFDMTVRTEMSINENLFLDVSTGGLITNPFGNQITYSESQRKLNFSNIFFNTQTKTQGSINSLDIDQCYIEKNGISMVELEEFVHFSEGNILNSQYQLDNQSIDRANLAFSELKNMGLKAHHIMTSDFKMKFSNELIHVPDDQHYNFLKNIMDENNSEIYLNNRDLVALNGVGWIKSQEEANLYNLSSTWLKTSDKHNLHIGNEVYKSEYLPNEENTLRSSQQRSQSKYSFGQHNTNFLGGLYDGDGQIQHFQETVMQKINDYFPNKKILVDQVIAWEHKFTHPQNGHWEENITPSNTICTQDFVNCGEDEFDVNSNLGYYDDAFATTYKHLATISHGPQNESPDFNLSNNPLKPDGTANPKYNPNLQTLQTKKDLYVLGKYSNRFWMHGEMPVYYDAQNFTNSFSAMQNNWTNNFQYDYSVFKNMLTATGSEQDPILAAKKLFRFNYSSFDITHSNSEDIGKNIYEFVEPNGHGAIDNWKNEVITKSIADDNQLPYSTDYFTNSKRSVFDYIRDHLGYRLEVQQMETKKYLSPLLGPRLKVSIDLENRGFSAPKNPRKLYIVIMDQSGNHVKTTEIPADEWLNWTTDNSLDTKKSQITDGNYTNFKLDTDFDAINYNTHNIVKSFSTSGLNTGQKYNIALWMPDPSSSLNTSANKSDYAVKLANEPIRIGEKGENILGSFKAGTWVTEKPSNVISSNSQMININQTWASNRTMDRGITIPSGVTLEISNTTVKMPANTRIQVQMGGHLIVNNSTITSNCIDEPWQGIEVFGNNILNQSNSSNQGLVEIINESLIENAVDAVTLIGHTQDGELAWGTAGGILKARNSTFNNCRRGVEFMSYQNFSGNNPRRNKSVVIDCVFKFDDDFNNLYGAGQFGEGYHPVGISMWDVDGVLVKGSEFKNEITSINNSSVTHNKYEGQGIIGYDASPFIIPLTNPFSYPPVAVDWNEFSGFDIGVYSEHQEEANSITIRDNRFDNNKAGVYLKGSPNSSIIKNQFVIPDLSFGNVTDEVRSTGVYLFESSGFEVEENTFNGGLSATTHRDGGLIIQDMYESGATNEFVYRNTFDKLGYGFLAYGDNGDTYDNMGVTTHRGLELSCNDFGQENNNYQDWYIDEDATINPVQGSGSEPTGNTFSPSPLNTSGTPNSGNIYQGPSTFDLVQYFHFTNPNHDPEDNNLASGVIQNTGLNINTGNHCNSNFSQDGEVLVGHLDDIRTDLEIKEGEVQVLVGHYKDILNGGIKPNIMEILLDGDKTSKEVRDELFLGSPYLEDEILIAAINRDIPLSQWHLTEVLVWNSRLSRRVLTALNDVQPLTPYQYNLVKNADNGSQRLLLEMDIHKREMAIAQLKSDYTSKAWVCEDVNVYDQIIKLYDTKSDMKSVAICIDSELSNKNYSKATTRLNSFTQSSPNSDFEAYYDLKIDLKTNGKNWFQLSESQTRILDNLANGNTNFITEKVKGLQNFIAGNNQTFNPLPIKSNQIQTKKAYIGKPSDESFENILEVRYLTNSKTLMFISTQPGSTYQIVNNIGQVVKSGKVNNAIERMDVSFLQIGVYHIRMSSPDSSINYQDKFVVQ